MADHEIPISERGGPVLAIGRSHSKPFCCTCGAKNGKHHTSDCEIYSGRDRYMLIGVPKPPEQPDPVCCCGKTSEGQCPRCGQKMGGNG